MKFARVIERQGTSIVAASALLLFALSYSECSVAVEDGPSWSDILSSFDAMHAARISTKVLPGIGAVNRTLDSGASCDYYPATDIGEQLSAYMLTGNEKFRYDATRQLLYAHSLENADHFLVRYPQGAVPQNAECRPGQLTRDAQARQIYSFYLAYRALGSPVFLRWAENAASNMQLKLPRLPTNYWTSIPSGFWGLARNAPSFAPVYTKADGSDLWSTSPTYINSGGATIDVNQNAELMLAFWSLYSDWNSEQHGSATLNALVADESDNTLALTITNNAAVPGASCSPPTCDGGSGPMFQCVAPRRGALSLAQGSYLWAWDEPYGSYAGWSVATAYGSTVDYAADPKRQAWKSQLALLREWLMTASLGTPTSDHYYSSVGGLQCPGPTSLPAEHWEAWQTRVPIFYQGSSEADPCAPGAFLTGYVSRLFAAPALRSGGAYNHAYLSLAGVPQACYLRDSATKPAPAIDDVSVYVPRGKTMLERKVSYTNDHGHSRILGSQSFATSNAITAVANRDGIVFVALERQVADVVRGRLVKYQEDASASTMLNVEANGITQIAGYAQKYIGHQDFDYPISALSFDGNSVYVALNVYGTTSRLLRYHAGSSGNNMFYAQTNGYAALAGFQTQFNQVYVGHQDFDAIINAASSDCMQIYLAEQGNRILRYDLSAAGSGSNMFYSAANGIAPLTGYATQFNAQRPSYQDFNRAVSAISSDGTLLHVALWSSTAGGRVIRYSNAAVGSGANMLYTDSSGIAAYPGYAAAFVAGHVGYQDFANRIVDLRTRSEAPYVYLTLDAVSIGADPNALSFHAKYFKSTVEGGSMWRVLPDGVTRTFECLTTQPCTAPSNLSTPFNPSNSYELHPDYNQSLIEYSISLSGR